MATLTLKNMPDDLYARLKARAERHRRSLNREVMLMLEEGLQRPGPADVAATLARLKRLRAKQHGGPISEADLGPWRMKDQA